MNEPKRTISYLNYTEGQDSLESTAKAAVEACYLNGLKKLIFFSSSGRGVEISLDLMKADAPLEIIAVSLPKEFTVPAGAVIQVNDPAFQKKFESRGVKFLQPEKFSFQKLIDGPSWRENVIHKSLSVLGGGLAFAIQAVLAACDGNLVSEDEYVVAATADTAIICKASTSKDFFSKFIVREVLAKPFFLTLTRGERPVERRSLDRTGKS